ncbi:hypothetical protein MRS44_013880 [Fusarium solani]|uniref:uncharacterized protein n=1 Tax=Fusarium solani TaxID=169388 RepID=UPI0032C40637|nr:hypothetical protein MRS44_013880 [Fusarium solani]
MEVARNDYDPDLFICVSNSRVQREGDEATTEPDEVPEATRGHNFQPLNFEERQPILHITTSSIEDPARLFQLFVPETLVNTWVTYTNTAAAAMNPEERDKKTPWYPTNLSEVYTFLAILIYIGLHKEEELEDYWRVPTPGDLIPDHPIAKFLPLCRFHQLFRLLRIYDEDRLDRTETNDPLNYQKVDDFSSCLQGACMRIWGPGSRVAVDEAIIGYTGRSKLTITIPSKPDPTGFKVWVIAEGGFFLRWLFHTPNTTFGPAAGEITRRRPQELANRSLNPTQSVVVALVNLLPTATYHVFMDNLFSSPKLYRILRQRGIAATGTARINSGINAELVEHKKQDNKGKLQWPWDYYEAIPTADNQVRKNYDA